ncbi:MAG: hypothetical protein KL863_09295 [Rhizobium sp.]|nr:hypothetical protein [Rhizobium sp.]
MKTRSRLALTALVVCGTLAASMPQAFAWSCQAQADDGTYGYSYGFSNRRDARRRALAECNARTYDSCYIVDCQRNG